MATRGAWETTTTTTGPVLPRSLRCDPVHATSATAEQCASCLGCTPRELRPFSNRLLFTPVQERSCPVCTPRHMMFAGAACRLRLCLPVFVANALSPFTAVLVLPLLLQYPHCLCSFSARIAIASVLTFPCYFSTHIALVTSVLALPLYLQ